ncbi:MAG: hypothetical protein J0H54_11475 [Rhizobiales bacterium]|nr:hypothetical protein [Hyphomicrobiales bacterium]
MTKTILTAALLFGLAAVPAIADDLSAADAAAGGAESPELTACEARFAKEAGIKVEDIINTDSDLNGDGSTTFQLMAPGGRKAVCTANGGAVVSFRL